MVNNVQHTREGKITGKGSFIQKSYKSLDKIERLLGKITNGYISTHEKESLYVSVKSYAYL